MGFAILRVQKLKHLASVRRSLKHAFREQDTPNANPDLHAENTHIGAANVAEAMSGVESLLPEKRRKDAVLAIEYLVTASPEDMQAKSRQQQDAYFADALEWLRERHGAGNLVYAGIHRDELTPHLYAYVVPLDPASGRLNAKKWLGGAQALSQMQSEFAERVGRAHGLERGIEGSKAKHQTVRQFYAGLEATPEPPQITPEAIKPRVLEKGFLTSKVETPEAIAARLATTVQEHYAPHLAVAGQAKAERKRANDLAATAKAVQDKLAALKPFTDLFKGLTRDDLLEVARDVKERQERNRIEAEKQRRVDRLQSLTRLAGAVHTFATKALDATKAKAGEWRCVDWAEVEKASVREAVHEHRQSRVEAYRAVFEHSPGQVEASKQRIDAVLAQAAQADRTHEPRPPLSRRDRGPSL